MRFFLYIFIAIISLVSCGRGRIISELDRVKEMADSGKVEEATILLDSLQINFEFNESEQMYHDLLEIKISDKMDIVPENDSTILALLDYYIEKGNDNKLHPLVLYYAGRTYTELKDTPKAILYFHKALDIVNKEKEGILYSCIHAQLAQLFIYAGLTKYALNHFLEELEVEIQMKDTLSIVNTHMHIGTLYYNLGEKEEAYKVYKKLEGLVSHLNDSTLYAYYITQYASFLIREGNITEADSVIRSSNLDKSVQTLSSVTSILNGLDFAKGEMENAKERSLKALEGANIYVKRTTCGQLADIYLKEGDLKRGLEYAKRHRILSDSINEMEATDYLAQMEAIYDYSEREKQNQELKFENRIVKRNIIICVVVIIILICLMVIFYLRHRLRIANLKLRIEETRSEGEKLLEGLESDYNRLKEKAKAMETRLNSEERSQRIINSQIELSDVSRMIINKGTTPDEKVSSDDFSRLERALGELYPGFLDMLHALDLKDREFHDALLIAIKVPLKICANMLNISASGLANSRTRLMKKKAPDSALPDWAAYISSLRDSCAPSHIEN